MSRRFIGGAICSDVVPYSSPAVYSSPTRVLILRTRTWTRTPGLGWTRGVQELDSALYELELIN